MQYQTGDQVRILDENTGNTEVGVVTERVSESWYEVKTATDLPWMHESLILEKIDPVFCYKCGDAVLGDNCPCDVETEAQRSCRLAVA